MKRRYLISCLFLLSQLYAPAHSLSKEKETLSLKIDNLIKKAQKFDNTTSTQKPFINAFTRLARNQSALENNESFTKAWCILLHTKGFDRTVKKVLKQDGDSIYGYLFELESARKYHKDDKKIELNTHVACPQQINKREFDVVCEEADGTKLLIECKNVTWKSSKSKRKTQLKNQRDIVAAHQRAGLRIKYLLRSKKRIPQRWKTWLANQQIEFEEEEKEENEWETN